MNCPAITDAQRIAEAARQGLRMVAEGEDKTIEGWLIYGQALHAGLTLFKLGDSFNKKEFGRWKQDNIYSRNLRDKPSADDEAAALWAADPEHPARFGDTRRLHPRVRTVRGLWAKWNEAQRAPATPKPTFEEPTEAERETVRKLKAIYEDPAADPHFKEDVKRKLDTYEARFGDISKPETTRALSTKKELAHAITQMAVKKATKNEKAFSILEFAINHLYGSEEQMARVLNQLKKL